MRMRQISFGAQARDRVKRPLKENTQYGAARPRLSFLCWWFTQVPFECPEILTARVNYLQFNRCSALHGESSVNTSNEYCMHLCAESPHFKTKCMCITTYESLSGYVSDRILEDNLENDLRSLSLSKRKTSIVQNSAPVVTARELVLKKCGQEEPLPFEECYSKR